MWFRRDSIFPRQLLEYRLVMLGLKVRQHPMSLFLFILFYGPQDRTTGDEGFRSDDSNRFGPVCHVGR